MKLGQVTCGSFAKASILAFAAFAALSVGCSSPRDEVKSPAEKTAQVQAALEGRTGTTELMSAQIADETQQAPRVGKGRALEAKDDVASIPAGSGPLLASPKDDTQSDCPRKGGRFGSAK